MSLQDDGGRDTQLVSSHTDRAAVWVAGAWLGQAPGIGPMYTAT